MRSLPPRFPKRNPLCPRSTLFLFLLFSVVIILPDSAVALDDSAPLVGDVVVKGNQHFSEEKIKDQMSLKTNRWYNFVKKQRFYHWKLRRDQASIESFYRSQGFLEAVAAVTHLVQEENKAMIFVDVHEGIQTFIDSVMNRGGREEFGPKTRKLTNTVKPGSPLNPSKLDQVAFDIKTIYANNGYPYAEIKTQLNKTEDRKSARVIYEIDPGHKATFGEVSFRGLNLTRQKVAQRELTVKQGEVYSRAKIIDSQQRVYSTGLFSYVGLDAVNPGAKPQIPDFVLKVVERKPNYVDFKFGLGHYQPPRQTLDLTTADFLAEWGNRNLGGTGRKISLSLFSSYAIFPDPDFPVSADSIENLLYRFNLRFVEPWLLGRRILSDLNFYYEPGVKSLIQPYRIESYGADLNFSREISPYTKIWLTPSFQWVSIYDVLPEQEEEIKREQGINVRRRLILFAESDTRDNIFIPLNGSFTRLHSEFVGGFLGGDNHFFKLILSWNRYHRLGTPGKLNVLAIRFKGGYAERLRRGEYVPSFDRFYMGGASTVRGYAENSMGPKDSAGKVKGGKVMIIGNIEWRRALFWKFGYTVFADAGNLWLEPKNAKIKDLRVTAGIGIQFFTPIGPLRLDYAQRIIRDDDPEGGRFHLSILYAF